MIEERKNKYTMCFAIVQAAFSVHRPHWRLLSVRQLEPSAAAFITAEPDKWTAAGRSSDTLQEGMQTFTTSEMSSEELEVMTHPKIDVYIKDIYVLWDSSFWD